MFKTPQDMMNALANWLVMAIRGLVVNKTRKLLLFWGALPPVLGCDEYFT